MKAIKRGNRIYDIIKVEKGFLITKNRETGQVVEMSIPLRICFPCETFWCVEKDVNLEEFEKIYPIG